MGKLAFRRRILRRPHPARREVTCGDTNLDWPRHGAVQHMTGFWGRSYLGIERRAARRACQDTLSKGRHGFTVRENLPWQNTHMGLLEGNQAIWTTSLVQGLTGDPSKLIPLLGLASDCSAQSDCRACWRNSTRVRRPGNWTGRGKRCSHPPGEGEWRSKHDTGQLFPPITCYPTHGKRLAQRDCKIWWRCSVLPSPLLYRCLPEKRRAPTHRRRQHSVWREPSPPGGTARLEIGKPRRWHPLSSGPTSTWRQPSLSADRESWSELLKLRVRSTYMRNALTGHSNAKAGSDSSEGSACRFTTWSRKGMVGTVVTYPGWGLRTAWE